MNDDTAPPDPAVDLSVVVAARNAAETIEDQLAALLAQTWNGRWEIVVADNGSTDRTREIVARLADSNALLRLVDASGVRGAGHARNVGVRAARGESIAFCDADDIVGTGWIESMGDALQEGAFVTGPQEYETLNPAWMHGAFGTRTARELQSFSGIFPFGPTANLGLRRQLFDDIGGFDVDFLVGQDVELCLRGWLAGAELQFVGGAVVHYRYRPDLASLWRRSRQYGAVAPVIARRLAEVGRPTPPRWRGAKNWVWLVRRLPTLRTRAGRARWIVVAGGCVGRVVGSMESRRLML